MTGLTDVFSRILELSVTALPVMAVVVLVRGLLLRRVSRRTLYALWAVVGLRLVCPVSLPSPMSLFNLPSAQTMQSAAGSVAPTLRGTVLPGGGAVTPIPAGAAAVSVFTPGSNWGGLSVLELLALAWLAGMAAMLIYSVVGYARLRRRVSAAVLVEGNVRQCDAIATPFVLGFLRPKIYIPFRMLEEERDYILLHERTHIRRRDHLVKPLTFLLLAVYWFHPGVWLCWMGLCRDMEMSCDEAVLRTMGGDVKAAYSRSLLGFATGRRFPAPSPLSFGEHDASARIRHVLTWKKAAPAVTFLAVALCILAALVCGTDARSSSSLRNAGDKGIQDKSLFALSYDLSRDVADVSLYEEVYLNGELVSSRPVMENLFRERGEADAPLRRRGQLRLGVEIDRESSSLNWVRETETVRNAYPVNLSGRTFRTAEYKYGALGENESAKKPLSNGSILLYVLLGTDQGSRYCEPIFTTQKKWPDVWQQDVAAGVDIVVLLRLSMTPRKAGTVRVTDGAPIGDGAHSFKLKLDENVQTLAYFADVYEHGKLYSSQLLSYLDLWETPKRDLKVAWGIDFTQTAAGDIRLLHAEQDDTEGWPVTAEIPVKIPQGYYVTGIMPLGVEPKAKQWDMPMEEGLYLCGVVCSETPYSGISFLNQHDGLKEQLVNNNAVVVLVRAVPAVDKIGALVARQGTNPLAQTVQEPNIPAAQTLYDRRVPYVGDAPAMGKLVQGLDVGALGEYTVALFTAQRPFIYQINFKEKPADPDELDQTLWKSSCLLLALADNLDEVRWTYPMEENGEDTLRTSYLPLKDAESNLNLGQASNTHLADYMSLKDCAASPQDLQNLLNYLYMK